MGTLSKVYGHEGYVFGHVIASVDVSSHRQAALLQRILEREMRERAGKPEESLLAKWYNSLARTREQAAGESWPGWEKSW